MKKAIYSREHAVLVERIRRARLDAGIDQADAARLMGKSQSYISKVELGQRRIDIVQLKFFAKIYGKDLDFFLK